MKAALLQLFRDGTTAPLSERPVTTGAPQALLLLNDAFVQEQAAALARRVRREAGAGATDRRLLERAWTLATGRSPALATP